MTPLPHSGCACCTRPSTRSTALTGLFQPAATRRVGDGCMATLCGFRLPGIRTCWPDELATTLRRLARAPTLHKVVARRVRDLAGQGRVDLDRGAAGADAEVVEPGRQDRRLDAMPLRERDARRAGPGRRSPRPPRSNTGPPSRRLVRAGWPAGERHRAHRGAANPDVPARPAGAAPTPRSRVRCRRRRRPPPGRA